MKNAYKIARPLNKALHSCAALSLGPVACCINKKITLKSKKVRLP